MGRYLHLAVLSMLLISVLLVVNDLGIPVNGESQDDFEITANVTIDPEPGSELIDPLQPVTFTFRGPINISTLGIAVVVDNEGLKGKIFFPDNISIQYIPDWGYSYGSNVTFGLMGGEEGLLLENGTPAMEGNLSFNLSMPYPEKFLIPLEYQGITEQRGHLTLFTDEGRSIETVKSGNGGIFPLPDDYAGGFGVFDNGMDTAEVRIIRYGGPVFMIWDHIALTDYSPFLMTGYWDSRNGNVTFSFSHLMDRESVMDNFKRDGLKGEFVWMGRDLVFRPDNRDATKNYNVTILAGSDSVWGEEMQDDIWIRIEATEEEDRTFNYFLLFWVVILLLILLSGFFYSKAAYGGPKD